MPLIENNEPIEQDSFEALENISAASALVADVQGKIKIMRKLELDMITVDSWD